MRLRGIPTSIDHSEKGTERFPSPPFPLEILCQLELLFIVSNNLKPSATSIK